MVKSVEGICRNGKVELVEPLPEADGARVIVTWVHPAEPVNLGERGIAEREAADLRGRLAAFAEDWDRPEMTSYRRGEIVLILFPDSNLRTAKRRPGLIVSSDSSGPDSVIMTDNLATARYSEMDRTLGTLTRMAEVNEALRATLALQ